MRPSVSTTNLPTYTKLIALGYKRLEIHLARVSAIRKWSGGTILFATGSPEGS